MNNITIIGNVGQDPELRYTQKGLAQVKFSIATTYNKKDGAKETTWHDCVAWGEQAEAIAATAVKGTRMIVIGRYVTSEYTTKQGETKKKNEILVDDSGASLRWGEPKETPKFSKPKQASFDEEEAF